MNAIIRRFLSLFGCSPFVFSVTAPATHLVRHGSVIPVLLLPQLPEKEQVVPIIFTALPPKCAIAHGQARLVGRRAKFRASSGQLLTANVVKCENGCVVVLRRGKGSPFRRCL